MKVKERSYLMKTMYRRRENKITQVQRIPEVRGQTAKLKTIKLKLF